MWEEEIGETKVGREGVGPKTEGTECVQGEKNRRSLSQIFGEEDLVGREEDEGVR